jgi:DNA polymerase III gamma/tau subunit
VQLCYQTAILGRRDLAYAPDPRTGFEMTLLRMLAFKPGGAEPIAVGAGNAASRAGTTAGPASRTNVAQAGSTSGPLALTDWGVALAALDLGGAARQLASNCTFVGREGALVKLALDPAQAMLRTPALVERLAQSLTRHLGENVEVEITIGETALEPQRVRSNAPRKIPRERASVTGERSDDSGIPRKIRRDVAHRHRQTQPLSPAMAGNFGNMMKQAEALQRNMQKAQEEIARLEVVGRVRRRHGQSHHDRQARSETRADRSGGRG